jgi:hypothetical protein
MNTPACPIKKTEVLVKAHAEETVNALLRCILQRAEPVVGVRPFPFGRKTGLLPWSERLGWTCSREAGSKIGSIADDEVNVIGHHGVAANLGGKDLRQLNQPRSYPLLTVIIIAAGIAIVPAKEGPANTPEAMDGGGRCEAT